MIAATAKTKLCRSPKAFMPQCGMKICSQKEPFYTMDIISAIFFCQRSPYPVRIAVLEV